MSRTGMDDAWVDIAPPQAPPPSGDPVVLAGLAVVLAALLAIGLYLHTRPRLRARRGLRRLARELRGPAVDGKTTCFRIRAWLQTGFGHADLTAVRMSEEARQADWQAYLDTLSACCFRSEPADAAEARRLVEEAARWLHARPVRR